MQQLTPQWQQKINDLAQQYDVSTDAVLNLLQAVRNGNGSMAQFNHPELGGSGQWMQGGTTTVADKSNNSLKTKVDGLCLELSNVLVNQPVIYVPLNHQSQNQNQQQQQKGGYSDSSINGNNLGAGNWWLSDLGVPTMTGAQNDMRYAYFAEMNRLAIDINGQITIFDTLDHQISGVSQQQGASLSVTFNSQHGTIDLLNLPVISSDVNTEGDLSPTNVNLTTNEGSIDEINMTSIQTDSPSLVQDSSPDQTEDSSPNDSSPDQTSPSSVQDDSVVENFNPFSSTQDMDIFTKIEKLAVLMQKGILTEEEFVEKKTELLSRL
jgi:hypothetical protein